MELAAGIELDRVRCALEHQQAAVDPGGTAPVWDAVLVVESPLPWPRDVALMPPFSALGDRGVDGRRWRNQAVVPLAGERDAIRVMAFERDERAASVGPGPFTRREWVLDDVEQVTSLGSALLGARSDQLRSFERRRDDVSAASVDLLVCTHGTRDQCCGSMGTDVHRRLVDALAPTSDTVRVWRTSHTGGHRFAPTVISMPDGFAWAHLDSALAQQLAGRSGSLSMLSAHCRGPITVDSAPAQVADREGLIRFGWDWLASDRKAVVVAHNRHTLSTTVEVRAVAAEPTVMGVRVSVELDRQIPRPTCGVIESPEFVTESVWRVADVELLGDQTVAGAQ